MGTKHAPSGLVAKAPNAKSSIKLKRKVSFDETVQVFHLSSDPVLPATADEAQIPTPKSKIVTTRQLKPPGVTRSPEAPTLPTVIPQSAVINEAADITPRASPSSTERTPSDLGTKEPNAKSTKKPKRKVSFDETVHVFQLSSDPVSPTAADEVQIPKSKSKSKIVTTRKLKPPGVTRSVDATALPTVNLQRDLTVGRKTHKRRKLAVGTNP